MSIFSSLFSAKDSADSQIVIKPVSNVLGVTGMSRRQLAAYYREFGFFGADSALSKDEQSVIQQALRSGANQVSDEPRLVALQAMVEQLRDRKGEAEAKDVLTLRGAGFSASAAAESVRVVQDAIAILSPATGTIFPAQTVAKPTAAANDGCAAIAA